MFSKKVEEFDDLKQSLAVRDKDYNSVTLEKDNFVDYHNKFEREFEQREHLAEKFVALNEQYES